MGLNEVGASSVPREYRMLAQTLSNLIEQQAKNLSDAVRARG